MVININNLNQIGKVQHFEWGSLLWFFEPDDLDIERLSVGLIAFKPHSEHKEHLHSGDEQVIYVISGHGIQTINGVMETLNPGDLKHVPPYVRHKVINDSFEELKLIIVYTPSKFQQLLARPETPHFNEDVNVLTFLDDEKLKDLLNKLSEAINLSLAVIDVKGRFLITTDNYPAFCSMLAAVPNGRHCQPSILEACQNTALTNKPNLLFCCHGIASIIMPIYNGNNIIGYIKCGQVFLSEPDIENILPELSALCSNYGISKKNLLNEYRRIKLEPKSRLYAAAEATFAIANYITEMAASALRQKELDKSRIALIQEQIAKAELEKALREADLKLLQSKINPHFLFNTLNTIAQMAYLDGSVKVANLVWDLSGILRCTLRKTDQPISLREEINILKNYIDIQLSRFGERLSINLDIDHRLNDVVLPCMLLQPLVENAIIHGFECSRKKGIVTISVQQSGNNVMIMVEDNGLGFDPGSVAVSKGNGLGIQSVKNRLQYYYGNCHVFQIDSKPEKGTRVTLSFPKVEGTVYERH